MGSRREIGFFGFVFLMPYASFIPELRQVEVLAHEQHQFITIWLEGKQTHARPETAQSDKGRKLPFCHRDGQN